MPLTLPCFLDASWLSHRARHSSNLGGWGVHCFHPILRSLSRVTHNY